ncbi:MAG TPA: beta galactosidase jelly roll domain-containing protein [Bacteroidales bacterium]|nr:beta galactosidase jelly roll domain-containing protein [Bacteroidales bacterium]
MRAIILFTISMLLVPATSFAGYEKLSLLQSLKGEWSFSIGIDDKWAAPDYDDSDWEKIKVPSSWEDQGFNGYNGYAFYRKKINISSSLKNRMLYINLGYIDDVDEVYLNGRKIGSTGGFPPNYFTAYNAERIYYLPEDLIRFDGVNVIAVKVYDTEQAGGIVGGEVGIYGGKTSVDLDVNLQTVWKFREGDDLKRKDAAYDDSDWKDIFVPARWEDQGFRDYNGYGWYRKTFTYSGTDDERMIIVLGKIDDMDQVYINGTLVGSTGFFPPRTKNQPLSGQEYNAFRGYYLPAGLLKKGQKNVIAVRVLDTGGEGGIYEGPVGLISQKKYIQYWKEIKNGNY